MNQKIVNIVSICALVIALLSIGYSYSKKSKKQGYIISAELYQKYKGKMELEKKVSSSQSYNKTFFDSLQVEIQFMKQQVDAGKLDKSILEQKYMAYSKMYDGYKEKNESEIASYNEQIWNQLNQYVKDYGKENGYDYILGATGDGNIMYAKESENITEDVINYANKKYEGK